MLKRFLLDWWHMILYGKPKVLDKGYVGNSMYGVLVSGADTIAYLRAIGWEGKRK